MMTTRIDDILSEIEDLFPGGKCTGACRQFMHECLSSVKNSLGSDAVNLLEAYERGFAHDGKSDVFSVKAEIWQRWKQQAKSTDVDDPDICATKAVMMLAIDEAELHKQDVLDYLAWFVMLIERSRVMNAERLLALVTEFYDRIVSEPNRAK